MKTKKLTLAFLSLLALWACTKPEEETVPQESAPDLETIIEDDIFGKIRVCPDETNNLRKTILLETAVPSDLHIEFWKEADRSDLVRSESSIRKTSHAIRLIFMKENSQYHFQVIAADGKRSAVHDFSTGEIDIAMKAYIMDKTYEGDFRFKGYILYINKSSDFALMIDDHAEIVWYERFTPGKCSSFSYDRRTQTISFMHGMGQFKQNGAQMSCIDLYGKRILEAKSEDLEHSLMHHDVYRMKDGNWIYTHFVEREFDFSSLGNTDTGVETVRGDGLAIINAKKELLWEWNCFDHLDPLKDPDILATEPRPTIADWLHTNSIIEDDAGGLYISCNRPKQFMKIDRETGAVLYRLGYNGNVKIEGENQNELSPDRMHSLELGSDGEIHLFENGDRNREYSRVLSYKVNETEMTAECLNAITLPLDLRSHFNSNAYEVDENHYIVHTTAKLKTVIMEKTGNIVWSKPVDGLSFRAIYIPQPEL